MTVDELIAALQKLGESQVRHSYEETTLPVSVIEARKWSGRQGGQHDDVVLS